MCFTVVKDKNLEKVKKVGAKGDKTQVKDIELFKPSYKLSAFQNDYLPVFRKADTIEFLSWGFIQPQGSDNKDSAEIKFMTANAKAETIFEKKLYGKAILEKRCLIAIDGFYEWRHINQKTFPHFIYHASDPVLLIGGIWNEFVNHDTGEVKQTVSMITTAANPMMEVIHNMKKRMPFILDKETAFNWLNEDLKETEIAELMKPYEENKMKYHTVGRKLYPDSIESIEPVIYQEISNEQQSLF